MKKKIASHVILLITCLGQIWSIIEPFNDRETPPAFKVFIGVATLVLFLSIIFYQSYWIQSSHTLRVKLDMEKKLGQMANILDELVEDPHNVFKMKLAAWRIQVERKKFENIRNGHWVIYSLPTYSYFRYVFGSILSMLQEGDEYLTLSNLLFWRADLTSNDSFLKVNLAASEKVKIDRIIILNRQILSPYYPDKEEQLELIRLIDEFQRFRKGEAESYFSRMELRFFLSDRYEQDNTYPVPFALIRNKEKKLYMSVTPILSEKDSFPRIEINFWDNPFDYLFKRSLDNFERIAAQGKHTLLSLDEISVKIEPLKMQLGLGEYKDHKEFRSYHP